MGLVRTVEPATTPITLGEAKTYLRVPGDQGLDEDAQVEAFILAAVGSCERVTGRALITQTWRLTLRGCEDASNGAVWDAWLGWTIELPRPPLISVSSVAYLDTAGVSQSLAGSAYTVDTNSTPGRLVPVDSWPATSDAPNAVTITFVAGYGAAAAVPAEIKDRLLAAVAYRDQHREDPDEEFLDKLFRGAWYGGY